MFSPPARHDYKGLDDKDNNFVGIGDHRKTEFALNDAGTVDMKLYSGMSCGKATYGTTDEGKLELRHTMTVDSGVPQVPMVPHDEDGINAARTGISTMRTIISSPLR